MHLVQFSSRDPEGAAQAALGGRWLAQERAPQEDDSNSAYAN
jgi:hypothetical protein